MSLRDYIEKYGPEGVVWSWREALQHAHARGHWLNKHADPMEGERVGLDVDGAVGAAIEDPGLIWIQEGV